MHNCNQLLRIKSKLQLTTQNMRDQGRARNEKESHPVMCVIVMRPRHVTSKWGYTSPEVRLGSHHGTSRTKLVRLVEPGSKNEFF